MQTAVAKEVCYTQYFLAGYLFNPTSMESVNSKLLKICIWLNMLSTLVKYSPINFTPIKKHSILVKIFINVC